MNQKETERRKLPKRRIGPALIAVLFLATACTGDDGGLTVGLLDEEIVSATMAARIDRPAPEDPSAPRWTAEDTQWLRDDFLNDTIGYDDALSACIATEAKEGYDDSVSDVLYDLGSNGTAFGFYDRAIAPCLRQLVPDLDDRCHESYPDNCIPSPPPLLDCDDLEVSGFVVRGTDPHSFDVDNDGRGCEAQTDASTSDG